MTTPEQQKRQWTSKRGEIGKQFLLHAILLLGSILFLMPFVWMVSTSLKGPEDIFTLPPKWIPNPVVWENYSNALRARPFHLYLMNTCIITFLAVFGELLSCSLVAYAFATLRFPGRKVLFVIVLSTMMIPSQVRMVPSFVLFKYLHWIDTLKPLIVPAFFGLNAFSIFLLRQFFMTISKDLADAARIDGCSSFGIYWRIYLPLSKPVLATLAVFSFIAHWNDFMGPLIYINSEHKKTLALGLASFQGVSSTHWQMLMAASLVVLLPVIVIFFLAQRYFVRGIVLSGMKM